MKVHSGDDRASRDWQWSSTDIGLLIVSGVWIFSGLSHVLDFEHFTSVVEAHGVLPRYMMQALPAVPAAELAVGLWLASSIHQRSTLRSVAVSLILLVCLSFYLAITPATAIESVGCGCHGAGASKAIAALSTDVKLASLFLNCALCVVHFFILYWPSIGGAGAGSRVYR